MTRLFFWLEAHADSHTQPKLGAPSIAVKKLNGSARPTQPGGGSSTMSITERLLPHTFHGHQGAGGVRHDPTSLNERAHPRTFQRHQSAGGVCRHHTSLFFCRNPAPKCRPPRAVGQVAGSPTGQNFLNFALSRLRDASSDSFSVPDESGFAIACTAVTVDLLLNYSVLTSYFS